MRWQSRKQLKFPTSFSFYCKCSAIVLLFTLCALSVACGTSNSSQVDPSNQSVTVTIDLNGSNASPTPPLPDYLCGAWATNTSPGFNPNAPINVFAKFVHTVNNNPVGVDGATATAQIDWPDGTTDTATAKTTSDGLAVIPIMLKPNAGKYNAGAGSFAGTLIPAGNISSMSMTPQLKLGDSCGILLNEPLANCR